MDTPHMAHHLYGEYMWTLVVSQTRIWVSPADSKASIMSNLEQVKLETVRHECSIDDSDVGIWPI
jgi:hypothetical protein